MTEEIESIDIQDAIEEIKEDIIPNIYMYSEDTKEYTGCRQADKNPAESRLQGKFIPLVPANATLLEVPEYSENEIPVYSKEITSHPEEYEVSVVDEDGNTITETQTREIPEIIENWVIELDYRKNFLKVDEFLKVSAIETIGEQTGYIVVDKELGKQIEQNPDMFKIVDGEIVQKSDEEYDKEQADKRKQIFLQDFFKVNNFGYYRKVPKGYQSAVESMNVLLNVAQISNGVQAGLIIFYEEPDFTKPEQCTEEWLVEHQIIQPAMTLEQFKNLYVAFMTSWNTQEHN